MYLYIYMYILSVSIRHLWDYHNPRWEILSTSWVHAGSLSPEPPSSPKWCHCCHSAPWPVPWKPRAQNASEGADRIEKLMLSWTYSDHPGWWAIQFWTCWTPCSHVLTWLGHFFFLRSSPDLNSHSNLGKEHGRKKVQTHAGKKRLNLHLQPQPLHGRIKILKAPQIRWYFFPWQSQVGFMLPPWQPPQRPDATPAAKRATAGHNMRDPGYFLTASRGGAGPFQSLSEATMLSGHHLETKSKPPEPAWIPRMADAQRYRCRNM